MTRAQRWTLVAACCFQFMILLDDRERRAAGDPARAARRSGDLEWTINAYVIALASLILVGGTLGDRYGRRRMLTLGFTVFTLFSAGCALAPSDDVLSRCARSREPAQRS